jgi:uncharacterized BrkB/YihY/UPF0761 family membrane protein
LAAAVALMLWLYWTAFAILVGAEFNMEVQRAKAPQNTPADETPAHPATAA